MKCSGRLPPPPPSVIGVMMRWQSRLAVAVQTRQPSHGVLVVGEAALCSLLETALLDLDRLMEGLKKTKEAMVP